jgi:uncharacterized membrane protein YsdA (DUF1294 family)
MQWIMGLIVLGLDALLTNFAQHQWENLSTLILIWMLAINVIALGVYRYDKSIAGTGARRIPEMTLHLLALIGGTFGAYLGMWLPPHHKTSKVEFQIGYWLVVVVQVGLLAWVMRGVV